jgi:alpha-tubulin suppressor-like RCC1 family protein
LFCFGDNDVGQAGQDTAQAQDSVPRAVAGDFRALQVAAGRNHTCAVALDGQAYCWGWNVLGVLGTPRAEVIITGTPQLVDGGFTFTQLSADGHTCGVTPAKELYCWGSNAGGQLGLGTRDNAEHATPTRVPLESPIALVATANGFTCAITDDGALYCWGLYPQSEAMVERLGDSRYSPVHVARGLRFRSVSTSPQNVCAVTTDDRLMCF